MEFTFSPEQEELRRTVRQFLEKTSPEAEVRRVMATERGYDAGTWRRMAGELGLLGTPVFVFHEGGDPVAGAAFKQIAKLSRGAYLSFDLASADRLKALLAAVAVYAAGGYRALTAYGAKKGGEVLRLTAQLRG